MSGSPPINDAATILLYRELSELEFFMVKRHAGSSFMANAMVFPGGQLESADLDPLWQRHGGVSDKAQEPESDSGTLDRSVALRVAAIRETFEEAGLLLAHQNGAPLTSASHSNLLEVERARLNAGAIDFAEFVTANTLQLQFGALRYFSRWVTPPIAKRRFDARFFMAKAPAGQDASPDLRETSSGQWISPHAALNQYEAGTIELAPPTLRILLELAAEPALVRTAVTSAPQIMAPQPVRKDGGFHLVLPGDPAYDPPGDTLNRITRRDDRWVSIGRGF